MGNNLKNYNILIDKLDRFIRRFYLNKLIRGTIYFFTLVIVLFLIFSLLESRFYFDKFIRKIIFYSFIFSSIGGFIYWVIYPLTKYFQLGKTISRAQAATIIGDHFSDVKDKLLNVLQLYDLTQSESNNELLFAGIDQKSEKIKLVPFKSAIKLGKNKKYLKYLIPPALILILILLVSPGTIKSSTNRIIENNKDFEAPAPFHFNILNKEMKVVQFEDFDLEASVYGDYMPSDVYIDLNGYEYRLEKNGDKFIYHFKNIREPVKFQLFSGKVKSKTYKLDVIPKPLVIDFTIDADYPAYTKQKDEVFKNTGDIVILEGTKLKWNLNAINTDSAFFEFGANKRKYIAAPKSKNEFQFKKVIRNNTGYKLFITNNEIDTPDSVAYSINVIKDKYPTITVQQFKDSLDNALLYFVGDASDDYGLTNIIFNYRIYDKNDNEIMYKKEKLKLK
ncbi:MAG TPA: DUF4175 domain-containing protein, partial [Bacteroidetes bacterium]|nr:DUF4175 domain-containing protein [Bacteroidota bacterium]